MLYAFLMPRLSLRSRLFASTTRPAYDRLHLPLHNSPPALRFLRCFHSIMVCRQRDRPQLGSTRPFWAFSLYRKGHRAPIRKAALRRGTIYAEKVCIRTLFCLAAPGPGRILEPAWASIRQRCRQRLLRDCAFDRAGVPNCLRFGEPDTPADSRQVRDTKRRSDAQPSRYRTHLTRRSAANSAYRRSAGPQGAKSVYGPWTSAHFRPGESELCLC